MSATRERIVTAFLADPAGDAYKPFVGLVSADPEWVSAWHAKTTHLLVASLPWSDPWRKLTIVGDTAYTPAGDPFDPVALMVDLPVHDDDSWLAHLDDDPAVNVGVAHAGHSAWALYDHSSGDVWALLEDRFGSVTAAPAFAAHLRAVLAAVVVRRHQYTTPGDPFALVMGEACAGDVPGDVSGTESAGMRVRAAGALDGSLYADLRVS